MEKIVSDIKGRLGGISLYHKRGREYMRQIGHNGAMKRSCKSGGRPKVVTYSERIMAGNKSRYNGKQPEKIKEMLKILKKRQIIKSFKSTK
jgi:hypothetical protein